MRSNPVTCSHCGGVDHDFRTCSNALYCTNCQGTHAATYRGCPAHAKALKETLAKMRTELVEESCVHPNQNSSIITDAADKASTKEEFLDNLFNMSKSPLKPQANNKYGHLAPITFVDDPAYEFDEYYHDAIGAASSPIRKSNIPLGDDTNNHHKALPRTSVPQSQEEFFSFVQKQPEERFYILNKNGMKKLAPQLKDKNAKIAAVELKWSWWNNAEKIYVHKNSPAKLLFDTAEGNIILIQKEPF